MKHKAKTSTSSSPNKGKGKGGKGKEKIEPKSDSSGIDLRECPLSLPEFATADHNKLIPRYSSGILNHLVLRLKIFKPFLVLKRSEQDGIGFEDVDTLQIELEALLSATVVRKLRLKEEIKILSNLERYKGQGKSHKRVRSHLTHSIIVQSEILSICFLYCCDQDDMVLRCQVFK